MCSRILAFVLLGLASTRAHADAPYARDGNGAVIGFYSAIIEHGGDVLVSSTGFRFVVMRDRGWIRGPIDDTSEAIYFPSTDCSGQGYANLPRQYQGVLIPIRAGANAETLQALYYVPQDAVTVTVPFNSRLVQGSGGTPACLQIPRDISFGIPALPNDPNVTGVPSSDRVLPISITRNEVFRNGFDDASLNLVNAQALC